MGAQVRTGGVALLGPAIVAGIIGAILIDAFLILTKMAPFPGIWQYVASGVVGPAAFGSSSYIALGLCLHLAISIVWAILYAYVWNAINRLANWLVGGIVWGVVVMAGMQVLLAVKGMGQPPTVAGIVGGLVAHCVFFGLPVAWYLARSVRST